MDTTHQQSAHVAITTQPSNSSTIDGVEIKRMEAADSEFAGSMVVEAFRSKMEHAAGKDKLDVSKQMTAHEMKTRSPGGLNDTYIAWYQGQRAGFMSLKFHDTPKPDGEFQANGLGCCAMMRLMIMEMALNEEIKAGNCYLEILAVDGSMRGKGIGQAMLKKCDMEAQARGCRKCYLHVVHHNRAKGLYERHGYTNEETKTSCCLGCTVGENKFYRMDKIL